MTQNVTFGKRWNPVLKELFEPIDRSEALDFHRGKLPYVALVETEPGELRVVDMCFSQAYCHVLFLDAEKRPAVRYSFSQVDDRLFLEEAVIRFFRDGSDRPSHGEKYVFRTDGRVIRDLAAPGKPRERSEAEVDVEANFSPLPGFGDYEVILARERSGIA